MLLNEKTAHKNTTILISEEGSANSILEEAEEMKQDMEHERALTQKDDEIEDLKKQLENCNVASNSSTKLISENKFFTSEVNTHLQLMRTELIPMEGKLKSEKVAVIRQAIEGKIQDISNVLAKVK